MPLRHRFFIPSALLFAVAASVPVAAQSSKPAPGVLGRIAGTWKEDETRMKLGDSVRLRFKRTAAGGLEEDRGAELAPQVQAITFDGKPHRVSSGRLIAWTQVDKNTFQRKLSDDQHLLTTRNLRIAPDGKTMTEDTDWVLAGGKTRRETIVYQRRSGDAQGLVGTWQGQSYRSSEPDQQKYELAGNNGIRFTDLAGRTYTVALDGKPVLMTGGTVVPDAMVAVKAVDDYTLESTFSRNGVVTARDTLTISRDGKTMTVVDTELTANGKRQPSTNVYEKR